MIKLKDILNETLVKELEFDSSEDLAKYKAKHKMRPSTIVKVGGKEQKAGKTKSTSSTKAITFAALSNMSSKQKEDFEFHYEVDPNDEDELQRFVSGMDKDEAEQVLKDFGKK